MSDEYIKRWAKKLVGYKTKEGGSIFDLSDEIEDIIKSHLEKICEYVEFSYSDVDIDDEYFPEFTYIMSCNDKKVYIGAYVYGTLYIQIDHVEVD